MKSGLRAQFSTPRLIAALIVLKGLLFLLLLPPWQGPDEPERLEPAVIIARSNQYLPALAPQPQYQEAVISSMRQFRAWTFYERAEPAPDAKRFEEANLPAGPSKLYEGALPYLPWGLAIRWASVESVLSSLYVARLASLCLHLLVVLTVFWVAGRVFKDSDALRLCIAVVLMYALHPQLSFVTASVHPDNLGFLFSMLVLALTILVAERRRSAGISITWIGPLILTLGLAGISGYVVRKMLILAPFVVTGIPLVFGMRIAKRQRLEGVAKIILVCLIVTFGFCVLLFECPECVGWRLLGYPQLAGMDDFKEIGFAGWIRYAGILFTTFWLALGSLVNKLTTGWLLMLFVLLCGAVAGWYMVGFSDRWRQKSLGFADAKALAILGLWLFWVALSTLIAYGPHVANPEGRYLLAALPAVAVLWISGLQAWNEKARNWLLDSWCGLVLLLNSVVLFKYLIPIYYL